jgi:hypothetical protein
MFGLEIGNRGLLPSLKLKFLFFLYDAINILNNNVYSFFYKTQIIIFINENKFNIFNNLILMRDD